MTYVKALLIAFDQLVNAILGGWPDESLSSRAYRRYMDGNEWLCRTIDCLYIIQHRSGTTEAWEQANPILHKAERGVEFTVDGSIREKVGDGVTAWADLAYVGGGGGSGIPDAPNDGKMYGRKNGMWVEITEVTPPTSTLFTVSNGENFITNDSLNFEVKGA